MRLTDKLRKLARFDVGRLVLSDAARLNAAVCCLLALLMFLIVTAAVGVLLDNSYAGSVSASAFGIGMLCYFFLMSLVEGREDELKPALRFCLDGLMVLVLSSAIVIVAIGLVVLAGKLL